MFDKSEDKMTVRVTFEDGLKMLFGDSYRTWKDQLREYCGRFHMTPTKYEKSSSGWVKYGGLKWCLPSTLDYELSKEGEGRKASDFEPWTEFNLSNTGSHRPSEQEANEGSVGPR